MRFFVGLLIGIGAALAAATIWTHLSAEGGANTRTTPHRSTNAVETVLDLDAAKVVDVSREIEEAPREAIPATEPPASADAFTALEQAATAANEREESPPSVARLESRTQAADDAETSQPDVHANIQTASAWTPFHSRASARGFARHLAIKTGVDFDIVKEGPGRYDVVFEYANDAERRDIEQRIAAVAGTKPNDRSMETDYESNS